MNRNDKVKATLTAARKFVRSLLLVSESLLMTILTTFGEYSRNGRRAKFDVIEPSQTSKIKKKYLDLHKDRTEDPRSRVGVGFLEKERCKLRLLVVLRRHSGRKRILGTEKPGECI